MECKKIHCANNIIYKKIDFEFNDEHPTFCKSQIKKKSKFLTLLLGLVFISEIVRTQTNNKHSHEIPQNT